MGVKRGPKGWRAGVAYSSPVGPQGVRWSPECRQQPMASLWPAPSMGSESFVRNLLSELRKTQSVVHSNWSLFLVGEPCSRRPEVTPRSNPWPTAVRGVGGRRLPCRGRCLSWRSSCACFAAARYRHCYIIINHAGVWVAPPRPAPWWSGTASSHPVGARRVTARRPGEKLK